MAAVGKAEKKARQQKKPHGHLVVKLPVWGTQAEFVGAQIAAAVPGKGDGQRRFVAHLLDGHGRKQNKILGRTFVPVSYKLLRPLAADYNANSVWAPLREAGLIEVKDYDRFNDLSNEYRLAAEFAEGIVERGVTTVEAALTSPRVDLVSGRKTTTVRKSEITDANDKPHPELIRGALKVLSRSPFYASAVEAHLDDLRSSAAAAHAVWLTAEKPASGPEWQQHVKARGRLLNDLSGYSAVLQQRIEPGVSPGVYTYATAYRPLMSGRIGQLGRGLQGASKRMKAAAYSGVPGAKNYDLQACHANVLIERLAEAGLDPSWFLIFADDRDSRTRDAKAIGIPESDFKACVYSLVNGAALPRKPKVGDDEGDVVTRVRRAVSPDAFESTWSLLLDVLAPARKVVRQWHRHLEETYDAEHGGTGRGEALEALHRLYREQDDADAETFVFRSPISRAGQNMPIDKDHVSKVFRKYREQVGLSERTSFHCLRHSYCTWLIQKGVTIPVVQKLAGHADIKTTLGYVYVAGNDLHDAVDAAFG